MMKSEKRRDAGSQKMTYKDNDYSARKMIFWWFLAVIIFAGFFWLLGEIGL